MNKEELEKENAELKEKISVLLSCKNCSENKGGWICAKEYENKCLSQKIVFIQELEKENAKLKEENTELKTKKIPQLERKIASIRGCHSVAVKKLNARIEQVERLKKENAELREQVKQMKCCGSL